MLREKEMNTQVNLPFYRGAEEQMKRDILDTPVCKICLPRRAWNVLLFNELRTVRDVLNYGLENVIKLRNIGNKTAQAILSAFEPFIECAGQEVEVKIDMVEDFESQIKNTLDQKVLNMPIEELNLPIRALNVLRKTGLKTVEDILNYELQSLARIRNVGRKTIDDIKKTILSLTGKEPLKGTFSFIDSIENIFSAITSKDLPVIKARYGYEDGKCKTLEKIGNKIGVTKERVRQIIVKELRRVKQQKKRKIFQPIIENLEKLLFRYKGIISINDIAKDEYFTSGTRRQIRFLINLIVEFYKEQYRITDKHFLTNLNDNAIEKLQSEIREAALKCKLPIEEKTFFENIVSALGAISQEYLAYHLTYNERIEILKGKVLSLGSLSIHQRVKLLLRDSDYPMHYTEITRRYREHFGDQKKYSDLEHNIHARISYSKDFIIVKPGTFVLREKFKIPENIEEIVKVTKEILRELGNISDTKFILNELRKRGINTGNLNEYSLKPILLSFPDIAGHRKFEIGLEELADKADRKSFVELLYDILISAHSELHATEIWRRISKQRGYPLYRIEQRLLDESKFIKTAPATYTVKENIPLFEVKKNKIIIFANAWIQVKKRPISAFLVKEVLNEEFKDRSLSLGLIEHVLSTCPQFKKITKGFYDLA